MTNAVEQSTKEQIGSSHSRDCGETNTPPKLEGRTFYCEIASLFIYTSTRTFPLGIGVHQIYSTPFYLMITLLLYHRLSIILFGDNIRIIELDGRQLYMTTTASMAKRMALSTLPPRTIRPVMSQVSTIQATRFVQCWHLSLE